MLPLTRSASGTVKLQNRRALYYFPGASIYASSKESVGDIRFRQFAKCMIQGDFCHMEGAEAVGFSHGQFGLVVETLNDAAGELLFGSEVVQDQRAVRA